MTTWLNVALAAAVVALVSPPAPVEESLASARALYAAAEYEESLAVLDKLQATEANTTEARGIETYRAYCLLALGRAADAEKAIAAVVSADPLYRPSASDVSPRVQSAFRAVRVKMLPGIIQARYAEAKASFDAKKFADAARLFSDVQEAIDDPEIAELARQSPLADLRTLSGGFKDLSVQAAAPPPPPAPAPSPVAPPPRAPEVIVPAITAGIFAADDHTVTPPVAIHQALPPFPAQTAQFGKHSGVLEVVVSESGQVESAAMRVSVNAKYDQMVLDAVKKWRYQPALREGVPVKYRKMVQVAVQ